MQQTKILDGKKLAWQMLDSLKPRILELAKLNVTPKLAIVMIGHNHASEIYVGNKIKRCQEYNLLAEIIRFDENASEDEVLSKLAELNNDSNIHGIIIQMPVPKHLNNMNLINAVDPCKDVDGFHPYNLGLLAGGNSDGLISCTPLGCLDLIQQYYPNISGKNIVIVGRSKIVGRPLASLLLNHDATVTICHSRTEDLAKHTKQADIVICAIGKSKFFTKEFFQPNCLVIDVGINVVSSDIGKRFCGDVDFYDVNGKVAALSPVPGGVGPLTVAYLLHNLIQATEQQS